MFIPKWFWINVSLRTVFFLIKAFLNNRAILKFGGWHDLRLKVFQNEWAE